LFAPWCEARQNKIDFAHRHARENVHFIAAVIVGLEMLKYCQILASPLRAISKLDTEVGGVSMRRTNAHSAAIT
jgi:hypothetical protein